MTIRAFKAWDLVHKWTSLICTAFLLVLCLTGLPLIFRDEIALWLRDEVTPPPLETNEPRGSLDRMVEAVKALRPDESIRFVSQDPDKPAWFIATGAAPDAPEDSAVFMFDARTGELLHQLPLREGLLHTLLKLHAELFAGLPGTLFLGGMGLVFLLSVASGVVVYGPFMRKLPFGTVRRDRLPRITWLDLHNLLGIGTSLWVVVVGLTGVVNTLAKPIVGYWQNTELARMTAPWRGKPAPATVSSLQQAVETAQAARPDLEVAIVALPGTRFAGDHHYAVFMRGTTPLTSRLIKPVLIEADTGTLTAVGEMPWYVTALLISEPLHFGDYGEVPLKIIWALLDLLAVVVLCSGLYLWLKKRHVSVEQQLIEDPTIDGVAAIPASRHVTSI